MMLPGFEPATIVLKSAILTYVPRSYCLIRNLYNIYIGANIHKLDLTSSRLDLTISD